MTNIVLASSNKHKLNELEKILDGIQLVSQADLGISSVPEDGLTFVENAIIKARHASRESGLPAISDDSGIEVSALGGAPGIYSARYSGIDATDEKNNTKLLSAMRDEQDRRASFFCCVVFLRRFDDPVPIIANGRWQGTLLSAPRGEGGFGYDPLLYIPEYQRSVAQLPVSIKNANSHRAKALFSMKTQLDGYLKSL